MKQRFTEIQIIKALQMQEKRGQGCGYMPRTWDMPSDVFQVEKQIWRLGNFRNQASESLGRREQAAQAACSRPILG